MDPKCPLCKVADDSMLHCFTQCTHFSESRTQLLYKLKDMHPSLPTDTDSGLLKFLLDPSATSDSLGMCCDYIKKVYDLRSSVS